MAERLSLPWPPCQSQYTHPQRVVRCLLQRGHARWLDKQAICPASGPSWITRQPLDGTPEPTQ